MNPALKHESVRDFTNGETKLFDHASEISKRTDLPLAAKVLMESIIELRDLHFFLSQCSKQTVSEKSMSFALEGYNYYLKRMHSTDSAALNKKMKQLFYEGISFFEILRIISLCVESMCNINVAMIQMSLKSVDEALRKTT
jgi:hypothetical protein